MMVTGRIFREGTGWSAHCDAIGAYTQGPTRAVAEANLVEVVELKIDRKGFSATLSDLGDGEVLIEANEPGLLAAEILKYQRDVHGLTLADVAKKLGAKSLSSYAAYEQGQREPSLSKFSELLGVVAPEMALTVRQRKTKVSR